MKINKKDKSLKSPSAATVTRAQRQQKQSSYPSSAETLSVIVTSANSNNNNNNSTNNLAAPAPLKKRPRKKPWEITPPFFNSLIPLLSSSFRPRPYSRRLAKPTHSPDYQASRPPRHRHYPGAVNICPKATNGRQPSGAGTSHARVHRISSDDRRRLAALTDGARGRGGLGACARTCRHSTLCMRRTNMYTYLDIYI